MDGGAARPPLISRDRVLSEVRRAVAEALQLDVAAVSPSSSLVGELGAASLDFLDVNYRLEQTFGIRMARHFFLEHAEEALGEGATVDERGRLTGLGLELLRHRYGPEAIAESARPPMIDEVPALVTVAAVAETVVETLSTLPAGCRCGATGWVSPDGARVSCGACGEPALYLDGDELIRRWLAAHAPAPMAAGSSSG